jgi:hypothetical protein
LVDVFDEVEEQLRSERYRTLFSRGWPFAVGLLVLGLLVAGGVWGWRTYQTHEAGKASITYSQAMDALAKNDNAGAEKLFAQLGKSGPAGFKPLALMQVAGLKLSRGDTKGGVELLDQAAGAAKDPLVGDAARLKAAYALLDTAPLDELEKRLLPLMEKGHPYGALAREALGLSRLGHGKVAEAKADFAILGIAPDASEGVRNRARAATLVIEAGQAGVLADLAKKAAALPPLPAQPEIIPNPNAPPPAASAASPAPVAGAE